MATHGHPPAALQISRTTAPRAPRTDRWTDRQPPWYITALPVESDVKQAAVLGVLACFLLVACVFFTFVVPLTSGRMQQPSAGLIPRVWWWAFVASLPVPVLQSQLSLAATLLAIGVAAFAVYGFAVYMTWRRQHSVLTLSVVVAFAFVSFLSSALGLPNRDRDIYSYMAFARVTAVHGQNLYTVAPDRFPDDPILPYANPLHTNVPDNKLPTWQVIAVALSKLAGDNILVNLFAFRFTLLFFNMASTVLLLLILLRMESRHVLSGVTIYAWNPIVAVHGQAKTDVVMTCCFLLGVLFLFHKRRLLGITAFLLSVFVKLITLQFLAAYLLHALRLRRWRELLVSTAAVGVTLAAMYAIFWERPSLFFEQLGTGAGEGGASTLRLVQVPILLALLVLVLWAGLAHDYDMAGLIKRWAVVGLVYSLFLAPREFSWYLITLLAVVGLAADWRILVVALPLSCLSFLANLWATGFSESFPEPGPWLAVVPRALVYLPLLWAALCVLVWLARHRVHRPVWQALPAHWSQP